jgi:hypothetical protein
VEQAFMPGKKFKQFLALAAGGEMKQPCAALFSMHATSFEV